MVIIAYQPLFKERIQFQDPGQIQVRASLFEQDQPEIFTLMVHTPHAAELLNTLLQTIRTHEQDIGYQEPGPDWEGMWCLVETGGEQRRKFVVLDTHIEALSDIGAALLAVDKHGRLAVLSTKKWLELAHRELDAGHVATAFVYAEAAFRRSRLPYLDLPMKDDSALKFRAARSTFASGRTTEAITMLVRLAEQRLSVLEDAWK